MSDGKVQQVSAEQFEKWAEQLKAIRVIVRTIATCDADGNKKRGEAGHALERLESELWDRHCNAVREETR